MSNFKSHMGKLLGEGGFGKVYGDGSYAIKEMSLAKLPKYRAFTKK